MSTNSGTNWKCLWRWITSQNLSGEELQTILDKKVTEDLFLGLKSYKPLKPESFPLLQSKYPDQVKLLNIVQILQNYIDIDVFQIWDLIKHFLYNISYGTLPNALENITYVDTRPSFLLPNIWNFYYSERLFLLRLLQYIVDNKNNVNHKYQEELRNLYNSSNRNLVSTLVEQFKDVVTAAPPSRKIQSDFGSETVRQEWAEYNLREQLALLQVIILVVDEESINVENFQKLFRIFRRHNFGKNQGYHELLEERHRDRCMQIMYLEICLFMVICSRKQVENPSSWIEGTEKLVDQELTNLQLGNEHSPMLLSWMILSLESKEHAKLFESKFQHYGSTAIRMCVFEFLNQMVNSSLLSDQSKCSKTIRHTIFKLLNAVCDRFDGDGTISRQPGVFPLCEELLSCPETADEFWHLLHKDESFGVVSLWNTALEYFPYNFSMLSSLAAGLAQAGKESARNLIGELKNLPVYTELYNPASVPLVWGVGGEAALARAHRPSAAYAAEAGSRAAVSERAEGTMVHFRTPYAYWAIFNDEVEKALDRKNHHRMNETLQRVYEGTKVLRGVVSALAEERSLPAGVARGCEGAFEVLVRLARADAARPLLAQCLRLCAALVPACATEIHLRLINTGVLPRLLSPALSAAEYAGGASLDAAAVGAFLGAGGGAGAHHFLEAYVDMLAAFHQWSGSARAWREVVAPGLVVVAREVVGGGAWRRAGGAGSARLLARAAALLAAVLRPLPPAPAPAPPPARAGAARLLQRIALYSLLYTDSARELLDIISLGNDRLDRIMLDETNWVSGPSMEYVSGLQQCVALLLLALRTRATLAQEGEGEGAGEGADLTPLDHLIFAQNKQKDPLKVVPRVTSYISHVYSKSLPVLSCRLLQRFADDFEMSLFSSLDMSAYQVRVMFLDRLRDEHESVELKVAILELVTTCVSKQPGLTEAFFMMNQERANVENSEAPDKTVVDKKSTSNDSFEGILGYMADYLGTIKSDTKLLHSPILGCIMGLFHALWKNNMQILVKKLRDSPKFWEYMTSPLFNEIQPGLRTYAQIFNVLGIEMFLARGACDAGLARALERLCDAHAPHLDRWIDFVFSFEGRADAEPVDRVPVWLGLLASWKDFAVILCRRPPITLNIAHKSKMVAPCMAALLHELEEPTDGRPVAILAELYAIMVANWRDDCFEDRRLNATQIERVLTSACAAYETLHPRAGRALLAAATGAVACLDYEIRADGAAARRLVRAVTAINGQELDRLLDAAKDAPEPAPQAPDTDAPAAVPALALLEQCLELYEDAFEELAEWFHASRFVSKLVWWLQAALGRPRHAPTALAALRCLTACARGPFAADLLAADVEQHLWLALLRVAADAPLYVAGLRLVAALVAGRGRLAAGAAVSFAGVHLEPLVLALRVPAAHPPALHAANAALHLVLQLLRYEPRWRLQNINSMITIMRSISECLQQSVTLALRARARAPTDAPHAPDLLHRSVELVQLSTRCLLWFSPGLLALLAGGPGAGAGELERWPPLVELAFGAPKLAEPAPPLTFGTLLAAVCLLTRMLNHAYHTEEGSGARSPRGRRRACSCGSPGAGAGGAGAGAGAGANRSSSVTSASSGASAPPPDTRLVATALEHAATLLATQALLAVRDPGVPPRHKQLVRRELASELTVYHDFVRKRILCAAHARPHLARAKLGAWPLPADAAELERVAAARRERAGAAAAADEPPPPPPPSKRAAPDSMREYILRKHYLDACTRTPPRARPPSPVSTSTPAPPPAPAPAPAPAPERRKERASKRVSWAETTRDGDRSLDAPDALDASLQDAEPAYSNLTDVQINNDEDYFHFMSVVFLYICQTDL